VGRQQLQQPGRSRARRLVPHEHERSHDVEHLPVGDVVCGEHAERVLAAGTTVLMSGGVGQDSVERREAAFQDPLGTESAGKAFRHRGPQGQSCASAEQVLQTILERVEIDVSETHGKPRDDLEGQSTHGPKRLERTVAGPALDMAADDRLNGPCLTGHAVRRERGEQMAALRTVVAAVEQQR
jgi:hypothetical protein